MKDIEKLISPLIESQFPDIYKDEGQNLIAFVKAYFEWMEQTNGVLYDSRRLPDYRDIDKTVDEFIDQFRTKYMHGIPKDAVLDKRILQKHIKEVYSAKGTTRGLQLLFRLLYNEDVEVYLPGDDVLKASDGRWYVPKYLEMESNQNLSLYVGKIITGRISGATAYVKDYQSFYIDSRIHNLLYLEDLIGNFSATEEIVNQEIIDDLGIDITQSPRIIGSLSSIDVTFSEPGFKLGEIVTIDGAGSFGKAIVTGVKKLNGSVDFAIVDGGNGYRLESTVSVSPSGSGTNANFVIGSISNPTSISLTTDIIQPAASVVIDASAPAYQVFGSNNATATWLTPINEVLDFQTYFYGTIETLAGIDPGSGYGANATVDVEDSLIYPLRIPDGAGGFFGKNANITGTAAFGSGAIANLAVYDSGVGYTNGSIVTILSSTNNSIQASGTVTSAKQGIGQGFFTDSKGFLNSDKFVHDNFFYQDYSYEVRANLALNKYAGVLRDLWHPAGVERFGKTTIKDEYKSRGTTVEALIDWLETIEVTVNTTRFTDTLFTTQYLTNTTFSTSKGTEYTTGKYTSKSTTYETSISVATTFNTITVVDTATAIVTNQDTIKYILTTLNTSVERATSTLISTNKVPATVTAISTAYATDTTKSTTTTYTTSSAIGITVLATSTAVNTTTVYSTSATKTTSTSYLTSFNTIYFDPAQAVGDDGFSSEGAATLAAEIAGLEGNPAWSCSYYEYGPVAEAKGAYLWAYLCTPEVSVSTAVATTKNTSTAISTQQTSLLTSTTYSTDTNYSTGTAKSTSISTSTAYATDTSISSFRITGTSIVADTAYSTGTIFERSTAYETLPVRATITSRMSYYSTKFDTKYATGVGETTFETSRDTSSATTTKYSTISSIKIATSTSYNTNVQTSIDTGIAFGTQILTSRNTDDITLFATTRLTTVSTDYYNTSLNTIVTKLTDIVTSTAFDTTYNTNSGTGIASTTIQTSRNTFPYTKFDTFKFTDTQTFFLTNKITSLATEYATAKDTTIATDTQISTALSPTTFETSVLTESATAFETDTNYISVYNTQYRTVTYVGTQIDTSTSALTQAFTSTAKSLSTTTLYNTVFTTATVFDTNTATLIGTGPSTSTNTTTSKSTATSKSTVTVYATSTAYNTITSYNTTSVYDTNTIFSTIVTTGANKTTTYLTASAYDTIFSTNKSTDTFRSTTTLFGASKNTDTAYITTFDTAFIAQDDVDILSVFGSETSFSSVITVPATAQTGQVAVLFDYGYATSAGAISNVLPSGWSDIANTANNSGGTGNAAFNCSYKILTSSDPGSSVTGINAPGQNYKIMLILTVGANVEIGSVTFATAGFNPPIDTAVANVSVALDTVSEGYTTSLILGFYGASSTPGTREFLGEPIPFDEIEQGIVVSGPIAVKYQNANAVEIDNSDTSVRLNMSDGGNKNLLGGVRISVNGAALTRITNFSTSKSTTTTFDTSKSTTSVFNTTTVFDTLFNTTTDKDTSIITLTGTDTIYDTSFLTATSQSTGTSLATLTSNLTDTSILTTTAFNTSTIYTTVFDTENGVSKNTLTATSKTTDITVATSIITNTVIEVSTYTSDITTVETGVDTFYDTKISTTYDTGKSTSTIFNTKLLTSTKFALTAINFDATTFVTSINTQYNTNKTTSTAINTGTASITSVDTDTIFDTIVTTIRNTEPGLIYTADNTVITADDNITTTDSE